MQVVINGLRGEHTHTHMHTHTHAHTHTYTPGCEITACQRTFSGQKQCLSGHTDICMKMSGQSFSKLKSKTIGNYIYNYKNFSGMFGKLYLCPWKLKYALTVCQPIFQKLFRTPYTHILWWHESDFKKSGACRPRAGVHLV